MSWSSRVSDYISRYPASLLPLTRTFSSLPLSFSAKGAVGESESSRSPPPNNSKPLKKVKMARWICGSFGECMYKEEALSVEEGSFCFFSQEASKMSQIGFRCHSSMFL